MRIAFTFATILSVCIFTIGCEQAPTKPAAAPAPPAGGTASTPAPSADAPAPTDVKMPSDASAKSAPADATAAVPTAAPAGFAPVAVEAGVVKLTPANTTIQIIGRHAAPRGGPNDPNARTIVFEKFTGEMMFDPATKMPKTAKAEIDATSLAAFDQRLSSHLKNNEFIDVEAFPSIKFASTRIEPAAEPGKVNIIGNLTLKDVTKEVTIPAAITNDGSGTTVHGKVTLNRRDFNIKHQNIDSSTMPEIDFTIFVGKKTERPVGGPQR